MVLFYKALWCMSQTKWPASSRRVDLWRPSRPATHGDPVLASSECHQGAAIFAMELATASQQGVTHVHLTHALGEIARPRLDHQMIVVGHQTIGITPPCIRRQTSEHIEERLSLLIAPIDIRQGIATEAVSESMRWSSPGEGTVPCLFRARGGVARLTHNCCSTMHSGWLWLAKPHAAPGRVHEAADHAGTSSRHVVQEHFPGSAAILAFREDSAGHRLLALPKLLRKNSCGMH